MKSPAVHGPVEETRESRAFRSAGRGDGRLLERHGYVREEFFVEGDAGTGAYATRVLVARPRDPGRFSGIAFIETFQTSVWLQVRDCLMRSGHGWALVSSRGGRWLRMLVAAGPERYARLRLPDDEINAEILDQVVELLRTPGAAPSFGAAPVRRVILTGYSGDAAGARLYLARHHAAARRPAGGRPFDGYFVAGTAVGSAPGPIGDVDRPVLEIMNENEMVRSFERGAGRLAYRRPDGELYRLYEIAGAGHITTRGARDDDPFYAPCLERPLSQLPMDHLYGNALHRLVEWIETGTPPPPAERIACEEDGRTLARDVHGNTVGGVRSTYLDVPFATYRVVSSRRPGAEAARLRCEMIAHIVPFSADKLTRLYGTPAAYADRVAARARALVRERRYLAEDAAELEAEARAFTW